MRERPLILESLDLAPAVRSAYEVARPAFEAKAISVALAIPERLVVLAEPDGVAQVLAQQDVSVKSVVQKGLADQARLVMVVHPVLESRFSAAMAELAQLPILRAPPRAIRVLEEEFG